MCGINGLFSTLDKDYIPIVKDMNKCIQFRGPDFQDYIHHDSCTMGHVRLSIIDTSQSSNQPFLSKDKRYSMVYNGEIYNYKELIKEHLNEFNITTSGDTEVLLLMFQKYGKQCLQYLNGMFAFAIYDSQEKTLFLARDRFGIKPLYYAYLNETFIFSSSVKGILSSGLVPKEIDPLMLNEYLRHQTVNDPNTIVKGIYSLQNGHYAIVNNEGYSTDKYYDFTLNNQHTSTLSKKEIQETIKDLFYKAVDLRMRADVPFGAFLSGGIDSSAVVAAMHSSAKKQINTFSIVFDDPKFNEGPFAKMLADKYKTKHTEILLNPKDLLKSIPEAMSFMDHPSGDGINTYLVSQVTRAKGIKMALSGLGGDELFAGYDLFKRIYAIEQKKWIFKIPYFLRKIMAKIITIPSGISYQKYAELLSLKEFSKEAVHDILRSTYSNKQISDLLANSVKNTIEKSDHLTDFGLSETSILEYNHYLKHTLLRDSDMMSMAHGLEVRVPFLDHTLIEFVLNVADDNKYPHTPKELLVQSLGSDIPSEIVNRPKMGFTFPWENWLKSDLKNLAQRSIETLSKRPYFNEKNTLKVWMGFLEGRKEYTWSRIWALVALELWLQENNIN